MSQADAPTRSSIDPAEVEKFAAMADAWWDPNGDFKPLHVFNPTRLGFIRDTACAHFGRGRRDKRPLDGLALIDIGCGGGLVSEPMRRLGAQVTGIDAAEANVKTAAVHAEQSGLSIDYLAMTAEAMVAVRPAAFDIVLALEIIEHVADPAAFLGDCAALLKPGGLMIVATINRTPKAFALAIVGAEYVLGWLPRGTHEYDKFVKPNEIKEPLRQAGLEIAPPTGVSYTPLLNAWRISSDTSVNYMITATKPQAV